jgi:tight adherence protein B
MAAARAFAARRGSGQPLAVVTFSSTATTLLPLTTDAQRIDTTLRAAPPTGGGTHVYDAVQSALGLVRAAHLAGASLVVLSDGSDVGSSAAAGDVLATAHKLHARIYGVGLRSPHFRPTTLEGLAAGTQGAYSEAGNARQLADIYRSLGSRLANAYVIRYRSLTGPGRRVHVRVAVDGVSGVGTAGYRSPLLAGGATARHHAATGWASPAAMVVVSALIALLVAAALGVGLRTRTQTVQDRVEPFVDGLVTTAAAADASDDEGPTAPQAGGRFRGKDWWRDYCLALDVSRLGIGPERLLTVTALGTLLVVVLIAVVSGRPALGLIGLLTPVAVREFVRARARKQRTLFADQLADNLQVVASALRAGHGLVGGFNSTVDDAPEPSRSELRRVLSDEQLGTPIETAMEIAITRMDNVDLEQVALVASVQRQTGGNAAEVLDRVVDSIRERMALRRLVRTLTAQGRLSGVVVSALPVFLLVAVSLLSPSFMSPLYHTTAGNVVLGLAAALIVAGWLCIRRIVNFHV